MRFGRTPLDEAGGAVLAHSVALPGGRLRKGRVLSEADIAALRAAGVAEITVARPEPGDIDEDTAAQRIAEALVPDPQAAGVELRAPFTGRVNIHARDIGLARFDVARLHALNLVDPGITLATVAPWTRLAPGALVATVKIIPYLVPANRVEAAAMAGAGALGLAPVVHREAELLVTRHDAGSSEETGKGFRAIEDRLTALGIALTDVVQVPHEPEALARALGKTRAPLVLILTASATSDPHDVGPEALWLAGGQVARVGIPVDPGNLLFHGALGDGRPVIGLPGCARSPAPNGADWVLERVAAGHPPDAEEIARMGVGGLLKEAPGRRQPREG